MNKNKHPDIKNALAVGALSALALASTAPAANAQPTSGGTSPSPTTEVAPPMTTADQELNQQAQVEIGTLAQGVQQLAASHPKNTRVTHQRGMDGTAIAVTKVTMPASTQYGSDRAAYSFTYFAPESENGESQPDKVEQLIISAGASGDPNSSTQPKSNVQIGFQVNPATEAWGASANYSNTLTNGPQSAVVGIDPVSSTVENMNIGQVNDLVAQGRDILDRAEHRDNIGDYSLPQTFTQTNTPVATVPNSPNNGGTAVPPNASMPSGGVSAS
jgi:hypothetical protein